MKKKLLIILASLVFLFAAALAIAVYKVNDIVAGYKPQIEQKLSEALGSSVEIGDISASLIPSTTVSISGFKIKNGATTSSSLSVKGISAAVALRPLLSKRLEVSNLTIERPRITLIKDASGISVDGISQRSTPPQSKPTTPPTPSDERGASDKSLSIEVKRISIEDGGVTLDDRLAKKKSEFRSILLDTGVEMKGSEIALPSLSLSFSIGASSPLSLTGRGISFSQDTGRLLIDSFDAKTNAGTVNLKGELLTKNQSGAFKLSSKGLDLKALTVQIKDAAPDLVPLNLVGSVLLDLSLRLSPSSQPGISGPVQLRSLGADLPGAMKLRALSGDIQLSGTTGDLSISAPSLTLTLQDSPITLAVGAQVSPSRIAVQSLTVKGVGGEMRLPTTVQLAPAKSFSTQPTLSSISVGELLKITKPALSQTISGTITGAKGTFSGPAEGDIARSLSGSGDLVMRDTVLKGVNIPALVLSKVSNIPLLEGTLRSHIAPEHQKYFADPDTRVKELRGEFSIGNGVINLRSLRASSDAFVLESSGTMSVSGDLNLASSLTLNTEISRSLANRSKTVRSMLNKQEQLAIPVVIQGRSPALIVLPDISKLLTTAGGKVLEEKAESLLRKALSGKKGAGGNGKQGKSVFGF